MLERLMELLGPLLSKSHETVLGALTILAVTTAATLVIRVLSHFWSAIGKYRDYRKKRYEILIDIIMYARFLEVSLQNVLSDANIATLSTNIEKNPKNFRAYNASINDVDEIFREYKSIRRTLNAVDMAIIDKFFGDARLFEAYYLKLSSDEFAELSKQRKLSVVTELKRIGDETLKAQERLQEGVKSLKSIAKKIDLNHIIPFGNESTQPDSKDPDTAMFKIILCFKDQKSSIIRRLAAMVQ